MIYWSLSVCWQSAMWSIASFLCLATKNFCAWLTHAPIETHFLMMMSFANVHRTLPRCFHHQLLVLNQLFLILFDLSQSLFLFLLDLFRFELTCILFTPCIRRVELVRCQTNTLFFCRCCGCRCCGFFLCSQPFEQVGNNLGYFLLSCGRFT